MPTIKRAQLVIETWEGDKVTSIQYEFDGVVNEFITVDGLQWLLELDRSQLLLYLTEHKLITRNRHGMLWVNCSDIIPLLGWTPS